jgi:hypothetical protein
MTRLSKLAKSKLAKFENQIVEVCAASERIALRVIVTALFFVGLWTVAKLLL